MKNWDITNCQQKTCIVTSYILIVNLALGPDGPTTPAHGTFTLGLYEAHHHDS